MEGFEAREWKGDKITFIALLIDHLNCYAQARPKRDRAEAGTAVIAAAVGCRLPWSRQGQQGPGPGPCSCCVAVTVPMSENSAPPPSVLVSQGCHHKALQTGWLKTAKHDSFTVLEPRGQQSGFWLGHALSEGSRGGAFLASSEILVLPAILGVSWPVNASLQCLPLSSRGILLVCPNLPLLSRIPVIGRGSTLSQNDLILT